MQRIHVHLRLQRLVEAVSQQIRHVQHQLVNLTRRDHHFAKKALWFGG